MSDIEKLTDLFKQFPGIGERQARRFVYFLLRKNPNYTKLLSDAIQSIHTQVRLCPESFHYFSPKFPEQQVSPILLDKNRDRTKLVVVERDTDLEAIEKNKVYNGHYFVLGGSVPVLESDPKKIIRTEELKKYITKKIDHDNLQEIILALSLTPQGEHTKDILLEEIQTKTHGLPIRLSTLGRGLSTGSELEYTDQQTLHNAFENRG